MKFILFINVKIPTIVYLSLLQINTTSECSKANKIFFFSSLMILLFMSCWNFMLSWAWKMFTTLRPDMLFLFLYLCFLHFRNGNSETQVVVLSCGNLQSLTIQQVFYGVIKLITSHGFESNILWHECFRCLLWWSCLTQVSMQWTEYRR